MAKEIKFNVKLVVDGKEQLVTATTSVAELRANLEAAKDRATRLRDSLITFNQSIDTLKTVQATVSQLAGTLNSVTEESRTFSAAMNAANTMAGKSGEDFSKLKSNVAELAETIPMARDELANGLYQVISNGVPEDNWIAYLQKSAKASVGGIADLGETVKVTSTIIKNYGLSWDKAGDVQDKIQLTAKNGVTSFEQLAQALPRVTSNAATLGVSIDELMATFATLTGVSGNTAEVSTQLAAIFTALVKPSSEAIKMAQQMGIEFDAAAIKAAGGMRNFLADLDKNVKVYANKSGMLEQEIYGKLFGSAESLRALGPLTGQLAAKFNENVEAMKDSAGTIDDAFATMSSSGAASLQMMKNKIGEFADNIMSAMGGIMPYLNITAQVGNSLIAVTALVGGLKNLAKIQAIVKVRTMAMNAASLVWNATSVRINALVQAMTASFRGAAVSATTLKLAIQGLFIATGIIGVAISALTEIIASFSSKAANAQKSAEDTADSMKNIGDAADEVKSAYDGALKNTYADLMAKYEKLKTGWRSLSSTQEKMNWIKGNKDAFNELRLSINDVTEAENIFNRKTDAVVEAFKQRAMAAAYAAKLTALYQKQIALLDKKQKVTKSIADDAKQGGRHAKEGDIVPESWRSERYGKVGSDGQWRFTKVGAERYNGTNVSGNTQINSVDKELDNVDREIATTQKQLNERLKSANSFITADKPTAPTPGKTTPKTTPGKHDTTAEPKTHLEELQAQLSAAQKEKGNAMTVEARVKADAKIQDIQAQIDEATKGKVSIEAETEPSYIVQGSDADKRQSHNNAGQRIDQIKQDFEIGLIGKEDAERQIADINKQLEKLGTDVPMVSDVIVQVGSETRFIQRGNVIKLATSADDGDARTAPSLTMYHQIGNTWSTEDGGVDVWQWKTVTAFISPTGVRFNADYFKWFSGSEDNVVDPIVVSYVLTPSSTFIVRQVSTGKVEPTDIVLSLTKHTGNKVEAWNDKGVTLKARYTQRDGLAGEKVIKSVKDIGDLFNLATLRVTANDANGQELCYTDIAIISDGEDFDVQVLAEGGNSIFNGEGSKKLTAYVYRNGQDITATIAPTSFSWKRQSGDVGDDKIWNSLHDGLGNVCTVNADDIDRSAMFMCEVAIG